MQFCSKASCSIYLPGLASRLALFAPLPPSVPLQSFPTFELPDAAMASEVRLVESNIVTVGEVTAAKRPQAFGAPTVLEH